MFKKNQIEEVFGVSEVLRKEGVEPEPEPCEVAEECGDWDMLEAACNACTKCPLHSTRKNVVFGEGDRNANLMFIGEGPGAEEDESGRPFVGRAGKLLTKMIEAMKFKREEVFIANIVKCRPPGNRNPFKEESDICIPYLYRQIELVNPTHIVTLGSVATQNILDTKEGITKLRGKFIDFKGRKLMPTFHPSYLLRSPSKKGPCWEDLKLVMKEFGKEPDN